MPSHPAAPVTFRATHLVPGSTYRVLVHRTGFHSNDAYSAYLEMGAPTNLNAAQIAFLNALTRDLPAVDLRMTTRKDGTLQILLPMNSNDIVLLTLEPAGK
jgi:xylan 1,4-beta-xylosidase